MERFILKKLLDWKNSPYRKPLILKGVRQVGKTWILKELADAVMKIQPILTSIKMNNTSSFLKQPRI